METAPEVKKTERGPTWPGRGLTKLQWPEPRGQTVDLSSDSRSKPTQKMCLANFFIFGKESKVIQLTTPLGTFTANRRQ